MHQQMDLYMFHLSKHLIYFRVNNFCVVVLDKNIHLISNNDLIKKYVRAKTLAKLLQETLWQIGNSIWPIRYLIQIYLLY